MFTAGDRDGDPGECILLRQGSVVFTCLEKCRFQQGLLLILFFNIFIYDVVCQRLLRNTSEPE